MWNSGPLFNWWAEFVIVSVTVGRLSIGNSLLVVNKSLFITPMALVGEGGGGGPGLAEETTWNHVSMIHYHMSKNRSHVTFLQSLYCWTCIQQYRLSRTQQETQIDSVEWKGPDFGFGWGLFSATVIESFIQFSNQWKTDIFKSATVLGNKPYLTIQ